MADENVQELTDEDIFEQHRAEIDEMFEEKNFFRRVADMFAGLKQPKSSREYKIARTELQRLAAPLVAILLPVVGVIVLIVMTAVSGQVEEHVTVDIAQITQEETKLEDEDPPEEEIDMTQDIDATVDVSTDVPTPEMANPAPPSPDPGGEPDKVSAAPSPVTMSAVGSGVKMRGLGSGAGGFGMLIGGGGRAQNIEGCLIGIVVDFKCNADGSPRKEYDEGNTRTGGYWNDVRSLLDANFSQAALSKFSVPPKKVALNHLFIERQLAVNAPKAFGVEKYMQPKGFIVYYSGKIKATEKARYRFVGYFDDFLVVRINNKVVLEDDYGHKKQGTKMAATGWASSSPDNGKWASMKGVATPLSVGDWFEVTPGKDLFMELIIGERPGGGMSGVLLIEKEGETYEKGNGGRPTLPIFASRPLSLKEKDKLREYAVKHDFKLSVDSPRFNARGMSKEQKQMSKDDVSVQVDI